MAVYSRKMRTTQIPKIFKFLTVGLLNTIIGLSVIYLAMFFFKVNPFVSNAIGYGVGLFLGYFLNKRWTFSSHHHDKSSLVIYLCVIAFSYLVNMAVVYFAINYIYLNPYVAQLLGMISYTIISYIGCNKLVFNRYSGELCS